MNEFKKGDIIVSLKDQQSSDRTEPCTIREGYIGENISPEDPKVVFFKDTPPAKGSYLSKNFREATADEKAQFIKGKKLVEPECPFEEGDIIVATEVISNPQSGEIIKEGFIGKISMMIKTKDVSKTVLWFDEYTGAFGINGFRLANNTELIMFDNDN